MKKEHMYWSCKYKISFKVFATLGSYRRHSNKNPIAMCVKVDNVTV